MSTRNKNVVFRDDSNESRKVREKKKSKKESVI